jgi:DNA-binding transcriptional LysR family regulator
LRAFEAAARHQNFSRAAEEVHLTHGAISHQVRALEAELGVLLFARHGKRITITPEGERFATLLRKSLHDIAAAAEAIKAGAKQKRLTVSALPSFAGRWLSAAGALHRTAPRSGGRAAIEQPIGRFRTRGDRRRDSFRTRQLSGTGGREVDG